MAATIVSTIIKERQTALLSFDLVDENGDSIDGAQINTMLLTYYDLASENIINNREDQNVNNANNVSIVIVPSPLQTTLTWTLQPEDSIIVDARRETEDHIAIFTWTWDGGTRHGAHEIQFTIENLMYVP